MSIKASGARRWRLIIPILVVIIVIVVALVVLVPKTQAAPEQPIAFSHKAMASVGIGCLFCHSDARQSPAAGMPSVQKCYGCHKVVDSNIPVIKEVLGYWDRQQPIPWVRVNVLPRFVFFSHEVHVNAGKNCEDCHGDVGNMTVDVPVVNMNMGWCLNCHEQQPDAQYLIECDICHR